MRPGARDPIVAFVTHARHVPATEREAFASALRREAIGGSLILKTCHRVEAYVANAADAERIAEAFPAAGGMLVGEDAVRHAIAVAIGRDSVVVGEDQILHQLRESVDAARRAGTLDPSLERLFAVALQVGRRARSWRQGPARSLADVALASIERQVGPLRAREILVVGAGRMGHLAARAAAAAGASVAVANRSSARAATVASSTGASQERFDPGPPIGSYAGVIVALAGPWPIGGATIDALATSATLVVDLSVPPAVPEMLPRILGRRLVTADMLALEDPGAVQADRASTRLDGLAERATSDVLDWLKRRDGRAAAEALVKRADREREDELAALWQRLPGLEPPARAAIEAMTQHLAQRLLRQPLERLGRDSDGEDERTVRELFAL